MEKCITPKPDESYTEFKARCHEFYADTTYALPNQIVTIAKTAWENSEELHKFITGHMIPK